MQLAPAPPKFTWWRRTVYIADRSVLFLGDWFETVARFAGVLMVFYSVAVDQFRNTAIFTAGLGLIAIEFAHKDRLDTIRKYCIRCGAERDGIGDFCPVCGEKYRADAVQGVSTK